jgi:hypothetical protein
VLRLFRIIKEIISTIVLIAFIAALIYGYSLYNDESFKENCEQLGVKCEVSEVVGTVKKAKVIFFDVLQRVKEISW